MNCEHVKELLSAYLDDELASDERQSVASHLRCCYTCSFVLADFRRFDALLSRLPRVEPQRSLENRLFSSMEYRKLTGTSGAYRYGCISSNSRAFSSRLRDDPTRPRLVSLPGGQLMRASGRRFASPPIRIHSSQPAVLYIMYALITLCVLLLSSVSELVGWRLGRKKVRVIYAEPAVLPVVRRQSFVLAGLWVFLCIGAVGALLSWIVQYIIDRSIRTF